MKRRSLFKRLLGGVAAACGVKTCGTPVPAQPPFEVKVDYFRFFPAYQYSSKQEARLVDYAKRRGHEIGRELGTGNPAPGTSHP